MRFIALLALFLLSMTASGQNMRFEKAKVKGIETNKYMEVEGIEFPILKTVSGKNFVFGVSQKTGEEYPIYIGEPTQEEYDGHQVWTNNGKYYYFTLTKNGYPYRRNLDVVQ